MRRFAKRLTLCLLTLLLLASWRSWSDSAELPEIVVLRVPQGWQTSEESYVFNEAAMREVYVALETYEREIDIWMKAYYELAERSELYAKGLESGLKSLRATLDAERRAWNAALRRARSPGFGVFGGIGYASSGSVEAVAGAGFVWRLF